MQTKITDESAQDIAFLKDMHTLDVLDCTISHKFLMIVTRSCPKISWLVLSDLSGDATLEYAIAPYCQNLIEMHLFCYEGYLRFAPEPNEALSIDGLNCLKGGCPLLRDVYFHFRQIPAHRHIPFTIRNTKREAFESFTKETRKKAADNALASDHVAQAYAQFDAEQEHTYAIRRTIQL